MKDSGGKETRLPARIEPFRAARTDPPMPPLACRDLFDRMMEIGPVDPGAMGPIPIGWGTIRAWAVGTFTRLSGWEFRMLRRLSVEYLAELQAAEDHRRPAPWNPAGADVDRKDEERRLRSVLG